MSTKKAAKKVAPRKKTTSARVDRAKKNITVKLTAKPIITTVALAKEGEFGMKLTMNDTVIEGRTDTIAQTLRSAAPDRLNTRVILTITHEGSKKPFERVWNIHMAKRAFVNTMYSNLVEKQAKLYLGVPHSVQPAAE